jgi:hypothetical protein
MPTDDQIRQPRRATKLKLLIEIVRLLSRHYLVHLAAYPEAVVPTLMEDPVYEQSSAQELYASRSLSRNPTATLEKITSQ